jgi:hypothetical protein
MPKAPPKEKASFTIANPDGVSVSFKVDGSVLGAIREAVSWLPADRRVKLLDMLQAKHAEMLAKESERTSIPAAVSP